MVPVKVPEDGRVPGSGRRGRLINAQRSDEPASLAHFLNWIL